MTRGPVEVSSYVFINDGVEIRTTLDDSPWPVTVSIGGDGDAVLSLTPEALIKLNTALSKVSAELAAKLNGTLA